MAIFKSVATKKSQRKPGRGVRKANRTKLTKIKNIVAAKTKVKR